MRSTSIALALTAVLFIPTPALAKPSHVIHGEVSITDHFRITRPPTAKADLSAEQGLQKQIADLQAAALSDALKRGTATTRSPQVMQLQLGQRAPMKGNTAYLSDRQFTADANACWNSAPRQDLFAGDNLRFSNPYWFYTPVYDSCACANYR